MKKPVILRKRFIPFETVDISGDELLFRDEDVIITRWNVIRPRADIAKGVSFAFLNEGYKISRFYAPDGSFVYWYCDIIDVEYERTKDEYTFIDLLVDVKIFPDGSVRILDVEEVADALETKLITVEQACRSLRKLDKLLGLIYGGNFPPEACRNEELWRI